MNTKLIFPIDQSSGLDESGKLIVLTNALNVLVSEGALVGDINDFLVDYEYPENTGCVIATIKDDAIADRSKFTKDGVASLISPQIELGDAIEQRDFSIASIKEKMRLMQKDPKMRLRMLVKDYKMFFKQNKSRFEKNPEEFKSVRELFLTDITGIFNEILPDLMQGKQLSTLLGIQQIAPKLSKEARDLSRLYKKALTQEKNSGMINKQAYGDLKETYADFMSSLMDTVFEGIDLPKGEDEELRPKNIAASRSYSRIADGRIRLFSVSKIKAVAIVGPNKKRVEYEVDVPSYALNPKNGYIYRLTTQDDYDEVARILGAPELDYLDGAINDVLGYGKLPVLRFKPNKDESQLISGFRSSDYKIVESDPEDDIEVKSYSEPNEKDTVDYWYNQYKSKYRRLEDVQDDAREVGYTLWQSKRDSLNRRIGDYRKTYKAQNEALVKLLNEYGFDDEITTFDLFGPEYGKDLVVWDGHKCVINKF